MYNVEIKDVPGEIESRLALSADRVREASLKLLSIAGLLSTHHTSTILNDITAWRKELADIDYDISQYALILADTEKVATEIYIASQETGDIMPTTPELLTETENMIQEEKKEEENK